MKNIFNDKIGSLKRLAMTIVASLAVTMIVTSSPADKPKVILGKDLVYVNIAWQYYLSKIKSGVTDLKRFEMEIVPVKDKKLEIFFRSYKKPLHRVLGSATTDGILETYIELNTVTGKCKGPYVMQ